MDDRQFRNAMGKFATGITVITTEVDGEMHGMTANAFMSVSLQPKLVLISIAEKAQMLNKIKASQKYAVNILADGQQEMSMIFAGQLKEKREVEFEYVAGMPVLKDALASIVCKVAAEYEAGDHILFIGEVQEIVQCEEKEPLLYFKGKYRNLLEAANV
ncbi:MAG: flavin reductase family protein [Ectobacillus sp.]